ncbi:hypothetical protein [Streptacidiphilus jiangxiensis]|uniref:Uncharacterized protein n=1 Tax=Streptacidiphilus jiangxiensis TaxID=235985 RepID=A0A1H8BNT8_STRJI|nr:hypothetical protein [Streptacidiphilus jiangxiensis]SEM84189.1 hypothetical protein SAMN05414137_1724 [Streptacidiphilus jiangxiensis]
MSPLPSIAPGAPEGDLLQPCPDPVRFHGKPVPKILAWTGEAPPAPGPPRDTDLRSVDGVRWETWTGTPTGEPLWTVHHPARQLELMDSRNRCLVGGGPAHRTPAGLLWLLPADPAHPDPRTTATDAIRTANPPLCLRHAHQAQRHCQRLAVECLVLLVPEVEIVAVRGIVHRPGADPCWEELHLDHPDLEFMVGQQLVAELRHPVVLDALPSLTQPGSDVRLAAAGPRASGRPR